jgi:hypothetical protein
MIERVRFVVTFTTVPGVNNGVRALRAVLKNALRRHGLRATNVREENAPTPDMSNQVAGSFGQLRRDVRGRLRERS